MFSVALLLASLVGNAVTGADDRAQQSTGANTAGGTPRPTTTASSGPPQVPPSVISRDETGRRTVRAIHLTEPLRVDGRLDEPVYQSVPAISHFIQSLPKEGAPASERTEAWVMFDGDNMYVAGRCWDSAPPEQWVANEMRRDTRQLLNNDHFRRLVRHLLRPAERVTCSTRTRSEHSPIEH